MTKGRRVKEKNPRGEREDSGRLHARQGSEKKKHLQMVVWIEENFGEQKQ